MHILKYYFYIIVPADLHELVSPGVRTVLAEVGR